MIYGFSDRRIYSPGFHFPGIDEGIIYSCVKNNIPMVLNGSIRDDGPLPEIFEHTYVGQDA